MSDGEEKIAAVTEKGHVLLCAGEEVPILGGAGKGVKLIKLGAGDRVLAARVMREMNDSFVVEKDGSSATFEITIRRGLTGRGGKGQQLFKRGKLARAVPSVPVVPELSGE